MTTTLADVAAALVIEEAAPDLERRFVGLRRLYGEAAYARLRAARFAIVGLGGVGSWAAEALARCGVAELVLFDLDHVAESNINRQVQALTSTIGQAKVLALRERIALIHPGCRVHAVEEFVTQDHWPGLLTAAGRGQGDLDALIDACDQVRAKETLARWSLASGVPIIAVGAAGGKQRPEAVQVAGLAEVTHDPLLAALRQRLRRAGVMPRAGGGKEHEASLTCVFSREPVQGTNLSVNGGTDSSTDGSTDGSLNCHGYGSSVMVTATFGMVAAGAAVSRLLGAARSPTP